MQKKNLDGIASVFANIDETDFDRTLKMFKGLSLEQQELFMQSSNLSEDFRKRILKDAADVKDEFGNLTITSKGLTKELGEQYIQTNACAKSFTKFKIGLGLVTTAIGLAITAYVTWKKSQEELANKTRESANALNEEFESISKNTEKYKALHEELKNANTTEERQAEIKTELLTIQEELNGLYDNESVKVNLVTGEYKEQLSILEKLNEEKTKNWFKDEDNNKGYNQALEKLTKENYYKLSHGMIAAGGDYNLVRDLVSSEFSDMISFNADENSMSFDLSLTANAEEANETINNFMDRISEMEDQFSDPTFYDKLWANLTKAYSKSQDLIDTYGEAAYTGAKKKIELNDPLSYQYKQAEEAVKLYNEAVTAGDKEAIDSAYERLNAIKNSTNEIYEQQKGYKLRATHQLGTQEEYAERIQEWEIIGEVINQVFDDADTRVADFNNSFLKEFGAKEFIDKLLHHSSTTLKAIYNAEGTASKEFGSLFSLMEENDLQIDELTNYLQSNNLIFDIDSDRIKHQLNIVYDTIKSELYTLNQEDGIDLTVRPVIDASKLEEAGYENSGEGTATVYSMRESRYKNGQVETVVVTPILPDGTVIPAGEMDRILGDWLFNDGEIPENILIDSFTGMDSIGIADQTSQRIHELHEARFADLEAMVDAGTLTPGFLKNNKTYAELLEEIGLEAYDLCKYLYEAKKAREDFIETNNKAESKDSVVRIDTLDKQLENVAKVYELFNQDGLQKLTSSELNAVIEDLKEIEGIDIDEFINTLISTPENGQEAFNELVDALMDTEKVLDAVNDGNRDFVESELKRLGITNAATIADNAMLQSKAKDIVATKNLLGLNKERILALEEEAGVTDDTREAFRLYLVQKSLDQVINTGGDISQLASLVGVLGIATQAWLDFYQARANLESYTIGGTKTINGETLYKKTEMRNGKEVTSYITKAMYQGLIDADKAAAEEYQKEIENQIAKYQPSASWNRSSYSSGKGSGSNSSSDPNESEFDWIERKIEVCDEKIEKLKTKIDDVATYQSKNANIDTTLDQMAEQMNNYDLAYAKYMERAESFGLPESYVAKIQEGFTAIEDIVENPDLAEDQSVIKQIEDYQEWYNKAEAVRKEKDELIKQGRELRIQKLDNIINDYENINDLLETYTSYREKLVSLRERKGENIQESEYTDLIKDQNLIQELLSQKYIKAQAKFNELIANGDIERYSEEWFEYTRELVANKTAMLECEESVLDYKEAIMDLRFKKFEELNAQLDHMNDSISSLSSLLGEDGLVVDGMMTDKGLAKIALYGQQLVNAKQKAAEYANAIKALTVNYENGNYTLDQYNEKLHELESGQNAAAQSIKEARDAIIALNEQAIQQQIEDMGELIQSKKDALQAEKDLADYQKDLAKKQKAIATLQAKIAALSMSTSREDIALRLQLEQDLVEAQEELTETQNDHELEMRQEALDKEQEVYTEKKEAEIEELKTNLDKQDALIEKYLERVTDNHDTVYDKLTEYGNHYGMEMTKQLCSPWENATSAAETFADAIGDIVSTLVIELSKIDTSGLGDLAEKAGVSEHPSIQGKWQKGQNGRYWYGEDPTADGDYWYLKNGIHPVGGEEYGFDEEGYMITGWDKSFDDKWRYFRSDGALVKSMWKPYGDDWYYLDKNGEMATNASIRTKDGKGYDIVDENGKWIGTQENPDFTKYPTTYAKGTRNAKPGLAIVNEKGAEAMMRKGDLINLEGGEKIFTAKQTENLFKMSKLSLDDMLAKFRQTMPTATLTQDNSVIINSPLFEVHGGLDVRMKEYIEREINSIPDRITKLRRTSKF